MKYVQIKRDTLKHIVDALAAAKACGLTSDVEQTVFDLSLEQAGGVIRLAQIAGMIHAEKKDHYEKRDTPCETF